MRRHRGARRPYWLPIVISWGIACFGLGPGRVVAAQVDVAHSKPVHIRSTAARNGNKDPINIEAAKLDYFDKEQKLVYRGHVVAVRGDTTLKTSRLVVFLTPKEVSNASGPPSSSSQVRRMEADGPVTIIAKDQIATGDAGIYERIENKIYLNGNVTLSQGPNVTKGDHLVYDTTTGQAVVTGHVRSMFLPNSTDEDKSKTSARAAGKPLPTTR